MRSKQGWRCRTTYGKQPDTQTVPLGHGYHCRGRGDLAAFALFAFLKTARGVKNTVDKVIGTAPAIARNFLTGNITHTFRESIPQITSTQGDILELALFRCDETFKRTDEKWAGWGWVYLGTTVAEIRVPVSFRYHLRLSDPWRLASRGQVCMVLAPQIRPSLPPAIHTAEMERRAESGWARFDKNEQLEDSNGV